MRTLPNLTLAVLCWFTSSLLVEINRVPRFGADYFVGLAFDLLLVVAACVFCAILWTKSQRARTLPTPIKALFAFAVPFVASLPIVVAQKAQFEKPIYIRHWDFYRAVYLRESDWWIVIAIHLFVSLLFAAALLFAIRRLEHHRPEAAHRGVPVGGPSRRIVILLLCVNFFLAWQYYLALAPGRPNYSLTHELAMGASIETFNLVDTDGVEIRYEPNTDRIFLVNFFATWCGPCCLEMPHLQKIWDENENDPRFSMVVVGFEPNGVLVKFKKDNGYTIPFASDEIGAVYNLFGLDGAIPHTCLLQNGTVRLSIAGYHENRLDELRRHLASILKPTATH